MARPKLGALEALRKLQEDQAALSRRAEQLREAAALELGHAVLDGGGIMLSPSEVKTLIAAHINSMGGSPAKRGGKSATDQTAVSDQTKMAA
jgi:hypothetical protein